MSCLAGMDRLVAEMIDVLPSSDAHLREFGRRCAVEEFSLDDTSGWMKELIAVLPRRARLALDRRNAAIALADGWAGGVGERRRRAESDVSSMQVLELRLHQQYDRCASLGVRPNDAHALAVFEADVGDLGAMARSALLDVVSIEAHRRFHRGETISATPTGRVVVLADRHPALADTVRSMLDAVNASPISAGTVVRGWIEPLANERLHLDSHMASLAS